MYNYICVCYAFSQLSVKRSSELLNNQSNKQSFVFFSTKYAKWDRFCFINNQNVDNAVLLKLKKIPIMRIVPSFESQIKSHTHAFNLFMHNLLMVYWAFFLFGSDIIL